MKKTQNSNIKGAVRKIFSEGRRIGETVAGKMHVKIFGPEMTDKDFLEKVWCDEYLCKKEKPFLFVAREAEDGSDGGAFVCPPSVKKDIILEADKICNHIFNILGSGDRNLGKDINWHTDFKTDHIWNPEKYYRDIKFSPGKGDIKVPWELSRFQHLTTLGEAYSLSGDEKYAKEFMDQITSWINKNPPSFGVNWHCTMDVALRACNWIHGYYYFKNSSVITDEFLLGFLKSLYRHGRHIMSNLENYESITTNHYLSDIAAMVFLGSFFLELPEAEGWRNFGVQSLMKEMGNQVYPDGVDFELSSCYHRLALEIFLFSTVLLVVDDGAFNGTNYKVVADKIFGKEYTDRLYKMFDAVLYLVQPDGRMPQIGDNDSGRFLRLYKREDLDMRYLLALGAVFFKERRWKIREFFETDEDIMEIAALYGRKGVETWKSLAESSIRDIQSKVFPDAGWTVMRRGQDHMIVVCGPNGQNGKGGHSHNDKLGITLHARGRDMLVDPGTYVYGADPAWRNRFRGTAYHNTVLVDGEEINRIKEKKLFTLNDNSFCEMNFWESCDEFDYFDGRHKGFARSKEPVTHRRQIHFDKGKSIWIMEDILTGKGEHQFTVCFHFAPQAVVLVDNETMVVEAQGSDGRKLFIVPVNAKNLSVDIAEGWFSRAYGEKEKTSIVKYTTRASCPAEIINILYAL